MADQTQQTTMDCILQEISGMGRRLEEMDNTMASLTAETKSMRLDMADFQSRVTGLEQRIATVETHITSSRNMDQELLYLYLCSKLIDLEEWSSRDNVRFLRFPKNVEDTDIHTYLRETLPKLTALIFDLPPGVSKSAQTRPQAMRHSQLPGPIIACLLRHTQTHQLLQMARTHGSFWMDGQEI
ncbi:hypothetical protein NDU88_002294 [Pleurodeles waltl]|uniref:Uncharacterized protein n=1 Tax=Pleurodeles waltl TaxID=8319 RepID=A0AAV7P989_PLEWA|nr:hypothetical protein NDU88_002294 [Pleurodeles waltl]